MRVLKALILAGGLSSRMGIDKSELVINGESLLDSLINLIHSAGLEVRISCREEQVPKLNMKAECLVDQFHQIGPMGGILSAFNTEINTTWLVIGCDMPNVDLSHIEELISKRDPLSDVTCFINETGQPEPLFCIWEFSAYTALRLAFTKMDYSLINAMHSLKRNEIRTTENNTFYNINTPEDLNDYLI